MQFGKEVGSGEIASESGRAIMFTGRRRAELQAVVLNMGGSLPGVYLVSTQVEAQQLSEEASSTVHQAEADSAPPLLVARAHFGSMLSMLKSGEEYVPPASDELRRMGADALAEEFRGVV